MATNLRMALQRNGRLAEGSMALLSQCGISLGGYKNQLLSVDEVFGLECIFARDDDIPDLIQSGICDIGIIGQNLLDEYRVQPGEPSDSLSVMMPLGFSRCRLSIAGPKGQRITDYSALQGKRIATSYPNTLRTYLHRYGVTATVLTMHGSVELAPQIGIADYICDLVSSGATLNENGLSECFQVQSSQAILVGRTASLETTKQEKLDRLLLRIQGVLDAQQYKYIMLHIDKQRLPDLKAMLPGCEFPTVIELKASPNKLAVHVVSLEEVFWETIEKLKAIGASSLLVLPIEKMIA